MNDKVKIRLLEPCVIDRKDEPRGATPTVSAKDARYLIGISKAEELAGEEKPVKPEKPKV
ncbi:MAG: hypothetical protein LBE75_06050 [Burkholderiales bacterium]|jgi:hypothetical protein|nr:hypothetical protein [Burkholderiales bacterium]